MQNRDSLFDWAIPCGTWFGVRVRLSPLFPLVFVVLGIQRWDAQLAAASGLCLLAAVLVHELAHVFAVRLTGGTASELLLWPLGGVTRISMASTPAAPVATALAGPIVSLVLAAICLPALLRSGAGWTLLDPLRLPAVNLAADLGYGLLALLFFANWLLVVANLLPALPLDGGRILETALTARLGPSLGPQAVYRAGMTVGFLVIVGGLLAESVWLCAVGAGLAAFNLRESMRQQMSENFDESFMGYDFSEGYTSLERSAPVETVEVRLSLFQRWMAHRRHLREQRQRAKAEEAERELDFLLAKVHTYGINSLSDSERRILKRASARYKGRTKSGDV
jgi:stage IV sporulation protein FB